MAVVWQLSDTAVSQLVEYRVIDRGFLYPQGGVVSVYLGDVPGDIRVGMLVLMYQAQGVAKLVEYDLFEIFRCRVYSERHRVIATGQGVGADQ
ncbi:hypothetical protein D3C78_1619390 [compost metagenome]